MRNRRVQFVRTLRATEMKFGVAVDCAGKRWRGFSTSRTAEQVRQTGCLGPVGLCMVCGGRVYDGWECLDDGRDACPDCALPPPRDKRFIGPNAGDWAVLEMEFFSNASFTVKQSGENQPVQR